MRPDWSPSSRSNPARSSSSRSASRRTAASRLSASCFMFWCTAGQSRSAARMRRSAVSESTAPISVVERSCSRRVCICGIGVEGRSPLRSRFSHSCSSTSSIEMRFRGSICSMREIRCRASLEMWSQYGDGKSRYPSLICGTITIPSPATAVSVCSNGRNPHNSTYNITPALHTSTLLPYGWPSKISGATKLGVPQRELMRALPEARCAASTSLLNP
mmetsp:Transcript_5610/g.13111  ORF Transcript_5610/g.13111 Transcript_5610/m.13111 type:complete len:217 (+) Transcript_5610:634-1284(+)